MKSKILLFVFIVSFYLPNYIMAQNTTIKKIEKTTDNVIKGKQLSDKIIKKRKLKKAKNKTVVNAVNTNNDSIKMVNASSNQITQQSNEIQEVPLTIKASKLFKNCVSKISNAEKNEIAAIMNFESTADDTQFLAGNDEYYSQYPFSVFVCPIDINNDSVEEIAIVYGHPAISGDNVISSLFIKDISGSYKLNFGFKGSLVILPNTNKIYPDIAIGGPGFEFPVWRWNGTQYNYFKKINDNQLIAANAIYIDEASDSCSGNLKK